MRNFINTILLFSFIALIGATATGCYQMPGEDDYSLIPCTNNPDITRDGGNSSLLPSGSF